MPSRHLLQGRDFNREKVRVRDGHTCTNKKCGLKWDGIGRRFHVHHLDGQCGKNSRGYDSVKDIPRMVTLCPGCHSKIHKSGRNGKLKDKHEIILAALKVGMTYDQLGRAFSVSAAAIYHNVNRK